MLTLRFTSTDKRRCRCLRGITFKPRSQEANQRRILDRATRQRRLNRQLEALEKDNFQDDPHANLPQLVKRLPQFDDRHESSYLNIGFLNASFYNCRYLGLGFWADPLLDSDQRDSIRDGEKLASGLDEACLCGDNFIAKRTRAIFGLE
ncbi:Zinc finger HIT domain-containing protein 1 [Acipenser ruthenus]|uniref:Zinc finger HIT domain-containing protein 1 n=1 Tax=Acipenser ruthenus TaxID=7906 RepID=A0A444UB68_ACIRT|nr:Zinc finger HIT domain-containing protein 1 [Acipenser ruthenus]